MKLADGKPVRWRLMAAMAQQDCGQCGYDCQQLFRRHLRRQGRAAEPVRAGRQGNRPHGQGAERGNRRGAGQAAPPRRSVGRKQHLAPQGAPGRYARQSGRRRRCSRVHLLNKARLREGDLARRIRHLRLAASTTRSATPSGCYPTNDPALVRRRHRGARCARPIFPSAAAPCARCCSTACRCRRRRTCCSSSTPTSPAASGGRRRRRCRPAKIRTATPKPSTCWRRSRNSPASGPIRKPSSRRSIRCSRGSIRSPPRPRRNPGRVALTVDAVRYDIGTRRRLGVASTFLADRVAAWQRDQASISRRRTPSRCRPTRPCRSS